MAAFFYRLAGSPSFRAPSTPTFRDVPRDNYYFKEIEWLAAQGISTGWSVNGAKKFRPLAPINRDAFAAFLARFTDLGEYIPPRTSPFSDVPTTHSFYKQLCWMYEAGISKGRVTSGKPEYRPLTPIARDALAAFLYRWWHSPDLLPNYRERL